MDKVGRAGITAAQSNDGYIYGLFCHSIERDLRHRRKLTVENFVVLDLVDHRGAADALLGAIDHLAQLNKCCFIHVTLPHNAPLSDEAGGTVLGPLQDGGHKISGIFLCKQIDLHLK